MNKTKTSAKPARRGFACMSLEQRRKIARKGGRKISRDRNHMRQIGGNGGRATQQRYKLVKRA